MENEPLNITEKIKMALSLILPSLLILTVLSVVILMINKRNSDENIIYPKISIKAPETIEIEKGEKFKITSYVTIKEGKEKLILKTYGDVDTSKAGEYDITVSATGSSKRSVRKKIEVIVNEKEEKKDSKDESPKKEETKEIKKQETTNKEENTETKVTIPEMEAKEQIEQKTEAKPSEQPIQQEQDPVQNEEQQPSEEIDDGKSSVTYYPDETEEPVYKNDFYNSEEACRLDHNTGECLPTVGNDGSSIIGYVWKIQ